jgi:hypothetical protein
MDVSVMCDTKVLIKVYPLLGTLPKIDYIGAGVIDLRVHFDSVSCIYIKLDLEIKKVLNPSNHIIT